MQPTAGPFWFWTTVSIFTLPLGLFPGAAGHTPCGGLPAEACAAPAAPAASARPEAMQASPHPFEELQSDGTRVRLYLRGTFERNWLEDEDGFTVMKDGGSFVYADLDGEGRLASTGHLVGSARPRELGLRRHRKPRMDLAEGGDPASRAAILHDPSRGISTVGGVLKNLVILIRFDDHESRGVPSAPDLDVIFNAPGGDPVLAPTGSVRDYFLENSYGAMSLESTVVGWVTLPNPEWYYAGGMSGLSTRMHEAIREALDRADALVDFGRFDEDRDGKVDAITFIHSGYGAEFGGTDSSNTGYVNRIWSHRWAIPTWTSEEGVSVQDYHISPGLWGLSGTAPGRIGVICHETGHFLGLPDLYDTDYGDPGEGVGSWGLMANSWGFDGSQLHPPHLCAWSKIELGWVEPTVIREPGSYAVPQAESEPVIYRIDLGYPRGEYLLIENRQPAGFESVIPQGGLCIWHIDEHAFFDTQGYPGQPGWPENGNHYSVALLQADGLYQLERGSNGRGDAGDPYHAGAVDRLGPDTVPSTHAYQGGSIVVTGNVIDEISPSGPVMWFRFSNQLPALFRRGDSDTNGETNLTDVVHTLKSLFQGGPEPSCPDSADVDDSGRLDLSDPVLLLMWLFLGGNPPTTPGQVCGGDPTDDDLSACDQQACE